MRRENTFKPKGFFTNPITTRSRLVLEMASELVTAPNQPYKQTKVLLRDQGTYEWPLALFGSSTYEGLDEVIAGTSALSIINPASAATIAYRGSKPYGSPQPIRLIGVIPSLDQCVFAVTRDTGIETFEEIAARRFPLHVSLRGQPDHCLHLMLEHICEAAGFTLDDLGAWGGEAIKDGMLPHPGSFKFDQIKKGEINAIFDEGAHQWLDEALAAGMQILPFAEDTVRKLEAVGYRRNVLEKRLYPQLPQDILTIDFSGWAVFVRADLPDQLVRQMCAAVEARKANIPWEEPGPLPVERWAHDAPDTPIDIPLHPAAEEYWRERGYPVTSRS